MVAGTPYIYPGSELALFAEARNWKRYVSDALSPFIRGRVAEIGAGTGNTTEVLAGTAHDAWFAVEPDAALIALLIQKRQAGFLPETIIPITGTLVNLGDAAPIDTIIYVDVLEHIDDDRAELVLAARMLAPGGRIIVLSPAYQALYTRFDEALGHERRYTISGLKRVAPPGLTLEKGFYLDSVGVLASVANRLMLRQAQPSRRQIAVWDRLLVTASRFMDPVIGRSFGRSVVAIWKRSRP